MATRFSHYLYNEEKYYTLGQVRQAIWKNERKIYAYETSDEDLIALGVTPIYVEYEPYVEPEEVRQEREAREALQRAKEERAFQVEHSVVEVDGMQFDADETSQSRMCRTIMGMQMAGMPDDYKMEWVLADNSVVEVTKAQLGEALVKAGMAQSSIWATPYKTEEPAEEAPVE